MTPRRIAVNAVVWALTDHVCRRPVEVGGFCGGRIVSKMLDDGKPFSRCTRCGLESPGHAETLCICGMKMQVGKLAGRDAGFRCVPNECRTDECPDEIVVKYAEALKPEKREKKVDGKDSGSGWLFDDGDDES